MLVLLDFPSLRYYIASYINKDYYPKVTTVDEDENLSWSVFQGFLLIAEMLYNLPDRLLWAIQAYFFILVLCKDSLYNIAT